MGRVGSEATDGQTVRVCSAMLRPVAPDAAAAVLAETAVEEPANGTVELAGSGGQAVSTI